MKKILIVILLLTIVPTIGYISYSKEPLNISGGAISDEHILLIENNRPVIINLKDNKVTELNVKDNIRAIFSSSIDICNYVIYFCDNSYNSKIYYGDILGKGILIAKSESDHKSKIYAKPMNPVIKGDYVAYQMEYISQTVLNKLYTYNIKTGIKVYVDDYTLGIHGWGNKNNDLYYFKHNTGDNISLMKYSLHNKERKPLKLLRDNSLLFLSISNSGRKIIAYGNNTAHIIDSNGKAIGKIEKKAGAYCWSPDDKYIAYHIDNDIEIYNINSRKINHASINKKYFGLLGWSKYNNMIVYYDESSIWLLDPKTLNQEKYYVP